jgi:hypothetical protein
VKNNANLRHVQEILGHKSLAIAVLKAAHHKFHPREKSVSVTRGTLTEALKVE